MLEVTDSEALTWFDVADTMSKALGRPITHYPTPPDVIRQVMLGMGRPAWLVEHMLKLAAFLREPKAAEVTTPWGESPAGQPPPWASSSPTSRPPSLRPLKTIALDSRHARSAKPREADLTPSCTVSPRLCMARPCSRSERFATRFPQPIHSH